VRKGRAITFHKWGQTEGVRAGVSHSQFSPAREKERKPSRNRKKKRAIGCAERTTFWRRGLIQGDEGVQIQRVVAGEERALLSGALKKGRCRCRETKGSGKGDSYARGLSSPKKGGCRNRSCEGSRAIHSRRERWVGEKGGGSWGELIRESSGSKKYVISKTSYA